METWQIIILVVLGIVIVGVVVTLFLKQQNKKKNKASVTIDVPRTLDRSHLQFDVPTIKVATQSFENTKKETVESITERHNEAAKAIREMVSNMSENSGSSERQTKNESKLHELGEKINNL